MVKKISIFYGWVCSQEILRRSGLGGTPKLWFSVRDKECGNAQVLEYWRPLDLHN